jgi:hypothetical protein
LQMKLKDPSFWHNWDDRGRITGDAKQPHRIFLPESIKNSGNHGKGEYAR